MSFSGRMISLSRSTDVENLLYPDRLSSSEIQYYHGLAGCIKLSPTTNGEAYELFRSLDQLLKRGNNNKTQDVVVCRCAGRKFWQTQDVVVGAVGLDA